jgi:hypothetical protein
MDLDLDPAVGGLFDLLGKELDRLVGVAAGIRGGSGRSGSCSRSGQHDGEDAPDNENPA